MQVILFSKLAQWQQVLYELGKIPQAVFLHSFGIKIYFPNFFLYLCSEMNLNGIKLLEPRNIFQTFSEMKELYPISYSHCILCFSENKER